jgi:hypothetical protein
MVISVGAERRADAGVAGGGHDLAGLQHDLARVERLAGGVGRAHAGAAAAHGARVGVEQLLPGEVLDDRGAEVSSSVSVRFGIGFIAPLGRSRSRRYMLSGEVNMWRSIVIGRIARNAMKLSDVSDPPDLVPQREVSSDSPSTSWRAGSR